MATPTVMRTTAATSFALVNGAIETAAWTIMLPTLAREFDATKTEAAWVVVAFALGLAGAGLAAGRLSDLIGLKRLGVVTFATEVILFAGMVVAPSLWMLYPLRFLQGIARAGSTNAAAAMLIGSYGAESRGRVLGMRYSLVYGGQIVGVLYAGQVVDDWGWRAAIAGVLALSLTHTLALIVMARPDTGDREPAAKILRRFDWPGALAFLAGISILIYSTQFFKGGTAQYGLLCLAIAAPIFWLAYRIERRASTPALDLTLFRSIPFSTSTASLLIMALCMGTANFLFPFYMQEGLGWSSATTSLAFVCMGAAQLCTSPVMGGLADRFGARRLVVTGICLAVGALALASTLGGSVDPWQVAIVMMFLGFGVVVFETPNNSIIFRHAGAGLGAASAITGVYRFVGLSLGGAMGASLLTMFGEDNIVAGFESSMRLLAIIAIVGLSLMQLTLTVSARSRAPAASEVSA